MPPAGRGTAITEIALSGAAAGSVRQTTQIRSAPLPSQPVALDTHCLAPVMTQSSPSRCAAVRKPVPGTGEAKFALPPGSLKAKAASGAPARSRNGAMNVFCCAGEPASITGIRPSSEPNNVSETLTSTD